MEQRENQRLPELSVIGCLCIEPEKLSAKIFEILRPEDFGFASAPAMRIASAKMHK